MANGFGSLYVGASAIQSQQNALNVVANNLSNVNTEGYVRQQVLFADRSYTNFATAAVSDQYYGLGVDIGDVVHARDVFLDRALRSTAGREAFYNTNAEIVDEVQTYLQEMDGEAFRTAISDLYEAFSEFSKDPSDTVNQNLIMQKSSLFVSRVANLDEGLRKYQSTLNKKISDDVDRINELGKEIHALNLQIQKVEAGGVETAMNLRDTRDLYLDELGALCKISTTETSDGFVKVTIDDAEFITEARYNEIGCLTDKITGFVTPYWTQLSDTVRGDYTFVFDTSNIAAEYKGDYGEVKALLVARGDKEANYFDIINESEYTYNLGISNSTMMNTEAELDKLFHQMVTSINDVFCPNTTLDKLSAFSGVTFPVSGTDEEGNQIRVDNNLIEISKDGGTTWETFSTEGKFLDVDNASYGSDGELPPRELFVRDGCSRYRRATINGETVYLYNPEDQQDQSKSYTIRSTSVNQDLIEEESLIPFKTKNGSIDYGMGSKLSAIWDADNFDLNPADPTPTTFQGFYAKWVGEIGNRGSIYETTAQTMTATKDSIENSRQSLQGVSSDEELTNMIKFQSAYNAASRYINVVSEMIEHLLSSVGR